MSYRVLARKWRPHDFTSLVGQHHVTQALINALTTQQLHHAYLFSGTRGVGKTTLARILAKCLNCETGITATPCNECKTCLEINEGRYIDLIEVDAASRTKVEDTRELLENVQYLPSRGRFKIYLIDEVHMLSQHSFNALLKTLEEPPEHVKFLLATTDPEKIPITVLSRCLQFNLKPLTPAEISQQLEFILHAEHIAYEAEALTYLSQRAEGSLRDALSLLDQAIAYGNGQLTTPLVTDMLGMLVRENVDAILQAIIDNQPAELMALSDAIYQLNGNYKTALTQLLELLHQIALKQAVKNYQPINVLSTKLAAFAATISPSDLQLYYEILTLCQQHFSLAPTPKIAFEMALLRLLQFRPAPQITHRPTPETAVTEPHISSTATIKNSLPSSVATNLADHWRALIPQLNLRGPLLALAQHCEFVQQDNHHWKFHLDKTQKILLTSKQQQRLQEILTEHLQQKISISITCEQAAPKSPANQQQQERHQHLKSATESLQNNPNLQHFIQEFDAKILPDSIKIAEETLQ
ncbi:MAG: DNA polymerase III subunit gamma/tau [Legionellales bacterium]|nr:DNA polymerase III subunit gamma/tau [Legionellales bacterium]